jgi:TRAP-type C4-dicarboxylate transport system permease small subunit
MMKLLHRLLAGAEWLSVRAGYAASVALLVMTVGVTLDVFARFLLGAGSKMAIEMSGYALVAIVFLGLAYTHKTNGHIEIDFLIKRLSNRAQRWCRVFNSIVFLAYTMLLGYFGWKSFWTSFQFSSTSRTGLDVLIWPYQLVIPLGLLVTSLLLTASICVDIARNIRHATDESAKAAS